MSDHDEYIKAIRSPIGHVEQVNFCTDINQMRKEIHRMKFHNHTVRMCFDSAAVAGLNGEDTYSMIAYNALTQLQTILAQLHHEAMTTKNVQIFKGDLS